MLTGLIIFGVLLATMVVMLGRYAVDTTDGRDWMERQTQ